MAKSDYTKNCDAFDLPCLNHAYKQGKVKDIANIYVTTNVLGQLFFNLKAGLPPEASDLASFPSLQDLNE